MWHCGVLECKNNSENASKKIYFHRFPESGPERKLWLLACGRQGWTPPSDAVVCSEHFGLNTLNSGLLVPTKAIHICCICLSTSRKLMSMSKQPTLVEQYAHLTGVKVTERSAHQMVCWECRARLASASRFRRNAIKAQRILSKVDDDPYYLLEIPSHRETRKLGTKLQMNINEPNHTDYVFRHVYDMIPVKATNSKAALKHDKRPIKKKDDSHSSRTNEVPSKAEERVLGSKCKHPTNAQDNPKRPRSDEVNVDLDKAIDDLSVRNNEHNAKAGESPIIDPLSKESVIVKNKESISKVGDETVMTDVKVEDDKTELNANTEFKMDDLKVECDDKIDDAGNAVEEAVGSTLKTIVTVDKIEVQIVEEVPRVKVEDEDDGVGSESGNRDESVKVKVVRKVNKVGKHKRRAVKKRVDRKQFVKLSEQIFTVKELTLEEQLLEIEKRREGRNYNMSPYKCDICYKGYRDEDAFKLHMNRHTERAGRYECNICKIRFRKRNYYHESKHSLRYICKQCPYVAVDKSAAKLHEKYHEGIKYLCPHCPEVYEKKTSYLSHLRIAHPTEHICELCGFSFINPKGLDLHRMLKHRFDDQQVPHDGPTCDHCSIQFLNKRALVTHMRESCKNNEFRRQFLRRSSKGVPKKLNRNRLKRRRVVPPTEPINCEQCEEQLPNFKSYFYHFRKTHPDKNRTVFPMGPYSCMCEICGRIMQNQTMLDEHKLTHSDLKSFKCSVCEKSFHTQRMLKTHEKRHIEGPRKMFSCDICGKGFISLGNMARHKFIHTGLKPFQCEICDKTFRMKQEKQQHIKYVHMKNPWPKRERGSRHQANHKQEPQYNK